MRAREAEIRNARTGYWFLWAVTLPILGLLALAAVKTPALLLHPEVGTLGDLVLWTVIVAGVGLFPVPVSRRLHLKLNYPVLLAISILYAPFTSALVALIGSFDSRELKGEITPTKAVFNRSQCALSWLAGSAVFHSLASVDSRIDILLSGVLLAVAADYVINIGLVCLATRFLYATPLKRILAQLRLGSMHEFLLNYMGLGLVGLVMARLYLSVAGMWAVVAFVFPLAFARQMFFRNLALEEAHVELKDRGRVLRALSNRLAEERQDERMQIAGYLHDDLAQMLFRLTLQAEMAKKRLARGDIEAVARDLESIISTKQQTSEMVRALIRDLHRSPIGRKGLGEALESFGEDMTRGLQTKVRTAVVEVSLPPPIQLLIYQIAREAAMNALKHAEPNTIWITLSEKDDGVELQIRDDGKGFDTSAPPPEGHFGSVMMKERAQVTGGTFRIESAVGHGTTVTATFPRVWLEEGTLLESQDGGASQGATADASETNGRQPTPSPAEALSRSPADADPVADVPPTLATAGAPPTPSPNSAATRRESLVGLLRRRSA